MAVRIVSFDWSDRCWLSSLDQGNFGSFDSVHTLTTSVQPSELSPASSALLAKLLPRYLDPEAYIVIQGGPEEASRLLDSEWGHSE
jgi:hypothetical protein